MSLFAHLKFNADGLIPAIVQEHSTGRVLMMAWMNRASLEKTLETGKTHFWSRSRQRFWMKGESSGHTQRLIAKQTEDRRPTFVEETVHFPLVALQRWQAADGKDLWQHAIEVGLNFPWGANANWSAFGCREPHLVAALRNRQERDRARRDAG